MRKLIAILLLSLPLSAQTWSKWNGVTVGSSAGNIGKWNGVTISTTAGNIGKWNNLNSPGGGGSPTNIGNVSGTSSGFSSGNGDVWYGIKVTTGSNGLGYSVNSASVQVNFITTTANIRVAIYDNSSLTTSLCSTTTQAATASSLNTISLTTACSSVTLSASHDYWVVLNADSNNIGYEILTSGLVADFISGAFASAPPSFASHASTGEMPQIYLTVTPK